MQELTIRHDFGDVTWLSVATAVKGSYRLDDVLQFLRRHLDEWTPERRWRILMCDVYAPHMDSSVVDLAWSRGYVCVYHGGGCTGVLQVNDTHLHYGLSQRYQDLEMQDLLQQQRLEPGRCPVRDREDCLRDLCASWTNADLHALAARGHWDNMLSNNLAGEQDHLARGAAAKFWS